MCTLHYVMHKTSWYCGKETLRQSRDEVVTAEVIEISFTQITTRFTFIHQYSILFAHNAPFPQLQHRKAVFFKPSWVSKWHPKILQWHPKFWKPRHGFALYWSKMTWGSKHVFLHMAIASDGCNIIGRTEFSGAEVGSENCKFANCVLSCAPPHFGLLLYCRRFLQYCFVRNCKNILM